MASTITKEYLPHINIFTGVTKQVQKEWDSFTTVPVAMAENKMIFRTNNIGLWCLKAGESHLRKEGQPGN